MKTTKATVVAAIWTATAAATIGLAAPAHADAPVNLTVTDDVREQLIQAGSVLTGRPASEYTGLRPGKTYYAYEPNGAHPTYWAAAALDGPMSELAQIRLQDQNSYFMFRKDGDPGATWIPTAAGFGPIPAGVQACPIPQTVRDLWNWPAGECYPPPQS
jgi:hypothetical protein